MPLTVNLAKSASHREQLASVRGSQAKASLPPQVPASVLPELAEQAIKKTHGKVLTAATAIGLSESHFGRLVNDGELKLKQLEALGPETLAALGKELIEQYGPLARSPLEHTERKLDEIQAAVNEVRQLVREIA